jgi:hypothetical protein
MFENPCACSFDGLIELFNVTFVVTCTMVKRLNTF